MVKSLMNVLDNKKEVLSKVNEGKMSSELWA